MKESIVRKVEVNELPTVWQKFPHLRTSHIFGDELIKNSKFKAFQIPSAIVPTEYKLIINPKKVTKEEIEILSIRRFL